MSRDKSYTFMRQVAPSLALAMILLATMVPFFLHGLDVALKVYPWVYAAGAALLLVASFFSVRKGDDMRLRRLRRMDSMAAVVFCVGTFFLFYHDFGWGRDWIAFTMAGAAIKIYTTLAIPRAEARKAAADAESKGGKQKR